MRSFSSIRKEASCEILRLGKQLGMIRNNLHRVVQGADKIEYDYDGLHSMLLLTRARCHNDEGYPKPTDSI